MEKPDWSAERSLLSLRDIGRTLLTEFQAWLDRIDTEAANAINTPDDET